MDFDLDFEERGVPRRLAFLHLDGQNTGTEGVLGFSCKIEIEREGRIESKLQEEGLLQDKLMMNLRLKKRCSFRDQSRSASQVSAPL